MASRRKWILTWLLLGLACLFLLQQPAVFFQAQPDETRAYQAVQNLASGTVDLPIRGMLLPLISLPFHVLGIVLSSITGAGWLIPFSTHLINSVLALVVVGLFYRLCLHVFDHDGISVLCSLLLVLGTPFNFYGVSFYNEVLACLLMLYPFWLIIRSDSTRGSFVLAGFTVALSALNRPDAILFALPVVLFLLYDRPDSILPFLAGLGTGAILVGGVVGLGASST
ncbi:MAG: glycosyltransferase family 39 protein, partial [bacterium]